ACESRRALLQAAPARGRPARAGDREASTSSAADAGSPQIAGEPTLARALLSSVPGIAAAAAIASRAARPFCAAAVHSMAPERKKGMAEAIPLQNYFFRDLRSST